MSVEDSSAGEQRFGRWSWQLDDDRWRWDEELLRLHGYRPGQVEPSTDLLIAHKIVEDRDAVRATLDSVRGAPRNFCSVNRIRPYRAAATQIVLAVGHPVRGDGPRVMQGWTVAVPTLEDPAPGPVGSRTRGPRGTSPDMSHGGDLATQVTALQAEVEQLRAALDSRDRIGQAKGVLMSRLGLDADAAFALLRRTSQNSNVKLAEVADLLMRSLPTSPPRADATISTVLGAITDQGARRHDRRHSG